MLKVTRNVEMPTGIGKDWMHVSGGFATWLAAGPVKTIWKSCLHAYASKARPLTLSTITFATTADPALIAYDDRTIRTGSRSGPAGTAVVDSPTALVATVVVVALAVVVVDAENRELEQPATSSTSTRANGRTEATLPGADRVPGRGRCDA